MSRTASVPRVIQVARVARGTSLRAVWRVRGSAGVVVARARASASPRRTRAVVVVVAFPLLSSPRGGGGVAPHHTLIARRLLLPPRRRAPIIRSSSSSSSRMVGHGGPAAAVAGACARQVGDPGGPGAARERGRGGPGVHRNVKPRRRGRRRRFGGDVTPRRACGAWVACVCRVCVACGVETSNLDGEVVVVGSGVMAWWRIQTSSLDHDE